MQVNDQTQTGLEGELCGSTVNVPFAAHFLGEVLPRFFGRLGVHCRPEAQRGDRCSKGFGFSFARVLLNPKSDRKAIGVQHGRSKARVQLGQEPSQVGGITGHGRGAEVREGLCR